MKKIKYYFNTHTLRYEKLVTPLRVILLRLFGFIAMALVTALILVSIAFRLIPSPQAKLAEAQYLKMKENYDVLNKQIQTVQQQMAALENRDNQVYRSIFESNPLPDTARVKLIEQQKEVAKIEAINNDKLGNELAKTLNNLSARIAFQLDSYAEVEELIKNQAEKLSSIPAIQPLSNRYLDRIASGFGMRIDPVYGTPKMHKGLDLTAPQGTPVYATGNGTINVSGYGAEGYGNHIKINHGYGYETLYGHLVKIKVRTGQKVKRGEVIGWVGSTGKSTGPHCHYEVHVNGHEVDPVYFFYNDLNAEEFDRILKIAATGSAKASINMNPPQIEFDFVEPHPPQKKEQKSTTVTKASPAKPLINISGKIKSNRGRKSLKSFMVEADLIEVPADDVLFKKLYYSIGDVADMFKLKASLIRFWENEFDILQPKKNGKGDRHFRPEDIKNLKLIYHLLRERKYTIEGAKEFLKTNKKAFEKFEMIASLKNLRSFLLELKASL